MSAGRQRGHPSPSQPPKLARSGTQRPMMFPGFWLVSNVSVSFVFLTYISVPSVFHVTFIVEWCMSGSFSFHQPTWPQCSFIVQITDRGHSSYGAQCWERSWIQRLIPTAGMCAACVSCTWFAGHWFLFLWLNQMNYPQNLTCGISWFIGFFCRPGIVGKLHFSLTG